MAKALKSYFDEETIDKLAVKIKSKDKNFNTKAFKKDLISGVSNLEYKDRIKLIAEHFEKYMSGDYKTNISHLVSIMPAEYPYEEGMFKENYWLNPIGDYIMIYGLDQYSISMNAMEALTKRNTAEFAIRPFIEKYPKKTLKRINKWCKSKNFHLRRLASEGLRPRLPWAKKMSIFLDQPEVIIAVLAQLKDDPIKYVQRSVANNLNDLLKENESFTLDVIKTWANQASPETRWIIKHAIRNYRKKKDPKEKMIMKCLNQ